MTVNNGSDSHSTIYFSSTQAFTLPIEAWALVHTNMSKSELRVTLCVLLNHFEVGREAELLSFTDIVEQTQLSRSNVASGLKRAIARGSVFKRSVGGQPYYEPGSKKSELMSCHDSSTNNGVNKNSNEKNMTCHAEKSELRTEIYNRLLQFGLARHVAENIALTDRYSETLLQTQISYVEHELESGAAPTSLNRLPGYVVNRIKYNRIAPPDFKSGNAFDPWMR